MEKSWEIAWKKTFKGKSNRFAEPLNNLWKGDNNCQVPVLFLNGTLVETGQRIIGNPIKINPDPTTTPDFADSLDIYRYIKSGKDMRLSTAIHNSARFTYVSPAGTLEGDLHVVDGGYFDNSGAITAMELVYAVRDKLKKMNKTAQLKVIMINNNPVPETNGSTGASLHCLFSQISQIQAVNLVYCFIDNCRIEGYHYIVIATRKQTWPAMKNHSGEKHGRDL